MSHSSIPGIPGRVFRTLCASRADAKTGESYGVTPCRPPAHKKTARRGKTPGKRTKTPDYGRTGNLKRTMDEAAASSVVLDEDDFED